MKTHQSKFTTIIQLSTRDLSRKSERIGNAFNYLIGNRRRRSAAMLVAMFMWATCAPMAVLAHAVDSKSVVPKMAAPKTGIKKGPCKVNKIVPTQIKTSEISDAQVMNARVFLDPLVPMPGPPDAQENERLGVALAAYKGQADTSDVNGLKKFLEDYPHTRWRPSLELNIARIRFENGYFTDALSLWSNVWQTTKDEKSPALKAIADESISQLLLLTGRLGETKKLESYLLQVEKRPMYGSQELKVKLAKEGLIAQKDRPRRSFKCGPYAVNCILNIGKPTETLNPLVDKLDSTPQGTSLSAVKKLADRVGLHYQLAKRNPGATMIVPSVVHYKLNHFAAITEQKNGKYHLQDRTFDEKGNFWLKAAALESELDGYALVPDGPLPSGWQTIDQAEAEKVWGKGLVGSASSTKGPADSVCIPCAIANYLTFDFGVDFKNLLQGPDGMAVANIFSMNSTLKVQDRPVGYTPPIGPAIGFFLNYNHQEGEQPSTYTFSNFGQDWTINWISYLTLDSSNNATVRPRGGGYQVFNYTLPDNIQNPYVPDLMTQTVLQVVSAGVYQRLLPNGSIEVFNQPDGTGRIFMTQVIDPQGNSAYIQYDSNFRLVSVTDAIGQVSTVSYLSNTSGNPGFYLISQITDPFGRSANFTYDSTDTYLLSSTDTIGVTSQFQYDTSSSFINLLTTPYGSTSFATYTYGDGLGNTCVVFKINYPDGTSAVNRLTYGDTIDQSDYWDRESMALYPLDFQTRGFTSHSLHTSHWETSPSYILMPVPDSSATALLAATTYTYAGGGTAGDGEHNTPGYSNQPATVTQGSETASFAYNAFGKVTHSVDPVGRTFTYLYSANNVDLLEARQTRGSNNDLLGKWIYNNNQHVPNKYIDGSGQVTQYSYNSFAEPVSVTDANNNTTTMSYNLNGQLVQVDGPMPGSSDVTSFTYDGFNRLYSVTDSQGYTVYMSYDNADRPTLTMYPDGTTEQTIYNRLDPVLQRDRIGRTTQFAYDSMRQPLYQIDPLGRKTQYAWCGCGSIAQLTDSNGNVTSFLHDQLGRLVTKTYNDSTTYNYTYDQYGNVVSRVDAMSQETDYAYNLDNTLATTSYHSPLTQAPVNYTWDPNYSRLTSVQNGWGTYTYAYNPYITIAFGTPTTGGGMLASVSNNVIANSTIAYQYDALGRTTNRQINGASNSVTWAYDAMSRVTGESNTLGSFAYQYVDDITGSSKGDSRLASISYPNGQVTNLNYFSPAQDERLLGIANLDPAGKLRSQFNYAYDSAGQIKRWGQQNAGYTPMQYALNYDQAGQLTAARASLNNTVTGGNQYFYNYDPGSNKTSSQSVAVQSARLGGTITAGDVLTITVQDSALSGGQELVNYTVQAGDTLSTVAAGLAAAVTADASLQAIGVNAVSSGSILKIKSASTNVTSYAQSTNSGATETVALGLNSNSVQNAAINLLGAGYQTQMNDVVSITVYDSGLSGGSGIISYTVPSNGASLSSIASGLASAISSDTTLSGLGVSATAASNVVSLSSTSSNLTTYTGAVTSSTSAGTETLTLGSNTVGNLTATVGGSAATGDTLTLAIRSSLLPGGQEVIGYVVPASSTLNSIASGISAAINADTNLQAIGLSSTSSSAVVTITSSPGYTGSHSSGATETIALGSVSNGNVAATIGGTITAGDTVTLQTSGAGLSAPVSSTYSVLSGDATSSIAAGLATAVNSNTSLQAIGVTAQNSANVVNVKYNPTNYPLASASVTSGAAESVSLAMNSNINQMAAIGGTTTTGDVLSLTVNDLDLSGGSSSVSYTVLSGDTLASITSGLAAAVNASSSLQSVGVSASASSSIMTLNSNSTNVTTYQQSTSSGATETIALGLNPNGTQTMAVGGTKTTGNVLTLLVNDAGLTGGQESVSYTVGSGDTLASIASGLASAINADTSLASIGVTASANSTVVNVLSSSINFTTYATNESTGATETLVLAPGAALTGDSFNTLNQLVARSATGSVAFAGQANKSIESANVQLSTISFSGPQDFVLNSYSPSTSPGSGATISLDGNYSSSYTTKGPIVFNYDGTLAAGIQWSMTVQNPNLPGGQETATYTETADDTLATIGTGIANAIWSDPLLQGLGLSASSAYNSSEFAYNLTVAQSVPTFTAATSSGATETALIGQSATPNSSLSIAGTPTAGDTISLTAHYTTLPSGQETVTYTALSGDTLNSIATGLAALFNADTNIQAANLMASNVTPASLETAEKFSAHPSLGASQNSPSVSATDGGDSTTTSSYALGINGAPAQNLTYDLNGNLLSDGTNAYQWDAENRLVQINYPGTGNSTAFTYDGLSHLVKIVETISGGGTNTKQFVAASGKLEARDGSGTLLNQYFGRGQTASGVNYLYDSNHRGDIVAVSTNTGGVIASIIYDAFGQPTTSGIFIPDFGFSGQYLHQRSGLNFAVYRAYSANRGRWLNRDPITESGGMNLYSYVGNNPITHVDPLGLYFSFQGTPFEVAQEKADLQQLAQEGLGPEIQFLANSPYQISIQPVPGLNNAQTTHPPFGNGSNIAYNPFGLFNGNHYLPNYGCPPRNSLAHELGHAYDYAFGDPRPKPYFPYLNHTLYQYFPPFSTPPYEETAIMFEDLNRLYLELGGTNVPLRGYYAE
jgi:RHS repeat-associated protein